MRCVAVEVQHGLRGESRTHCARAVHYCVARVGRAVEVVAVIHPSTAGAACNEAGRAALRGKVGPTHCSVVVHSLHPDVSNAVEMHHKTVRHVVAECCVVSRTCRVRPLPGEADLGSRVGERGGEVAAVQSRRAPSFAVRCLF